MIRQSAADAVPGLIALPRERFFNGDAPGEPCPEVLDLTGLGRILVYGPFLTIPPGRWTATIRLEVCEDAARRPFRIDFATGASVSQASFRPSGAGPLSASVDHQVTAASLAELRLWVLKPTFHGELRFLGATMECSQAWQGSSRPGGDPA